MTLKEACDQYDLLNKRYRLERESSEGQFEQEALTGNLEEVRARRKAQRNRHEAELQAFHDNFIKPLL